MGYLPKHIKVRRQRRCVVDVAMAALAGWTTHRVPVSSMTGPNIKYMLLSPTQGINGYYRSRARAARVAMTTLTGDTRAPLAYLHGVAWQ